MSTRCNNLWSRFKTGLIFLESGFKIVQRQGILERQTSCKRICIIENDSKIKSINAIDGCIRWIADKNGKEEI
ncbi:MAG TPA: hypothetical protein VFY68_14645 [Nitrososphaeraceae archaeon]|nr:hypothetical protein [Nitrososphaeraceae archaeon]